VTIGFETRYGYQKVGASMLYFPQNCRFLAMEQNWIRNPGGHLFGGISIMQPTSNKLLNYEI